VGVLDWMGRQGRVADEAEVGGGGGGRDGQRQQS
jgi:hypothetical protein